MTTKKKLLVALLTATCITAGSFGLVACTGAAGETGAQGAPGITPHIGQNGNWFIGETDTGVSATGPKGDSGVSVVYIATLGETTYAYLSDGSRIEIPSVETSLELGKNQLDLTEELAEYGVSYFFQAPETAKYLFAVEGDYVLQNASGTRYEEYADGLYLIDLNYGSSVEVVSNAQTGTVTVSKAEVATASLTVGDNDLSLAASGTTLVTDITVEEAGYYRFTLSDFVSDNSMAGLSTYNLTVGGQSYKIDCAFSTSVDIELPAEKTVVTVSSTLENTVACTLNVDKAPILTLGENTVSLTADNAFYGVEYSFTAPKAGTYKFSLTDELALVLDENWDDFINPNGYPGNTYAKVTLEEGETIVLTCCSDSSDAVITYVLTVEESEPDPIATDGSDNSFSVPATGSAYATTISAATAGNYELSVTFNFRQYDPTSLVFTVVIGNTTYTLNSENNFTATVALTTDSAAFSISSNEERAVDVILVVNEPTAE